ncbi:MAG: YdiY family protein [Pyrinomonadaceae bacterium]
MNKTSAWILLAMLLFLPVARVAASDVTLKNGDRISGTIVEKTEKAVVIETEYAGRITIDRDHIEAIGPPPAAPSSGPSPAETQSAATNGPKPDAAKPHPKEKARLFGGRFMGLTDGWEGDANVGFSYTSGNSNNTTMATGVRAVKNGLDDKLTVYARSLWISSHGSGRMLTKQNAFWGGARYDRKIDGRVFGFVSYDFERDRPKDLNFRSVAGGGLGHHFVKNDRTEIDMLAGGAWNRTWQPGDDTDTPEALAGATLKHKFNDRLRFRKAFTWYQNVTDVAEYRYILDATLSVDVTKRIGFYFTAGDRFNNDPLGSSKKNDFLFTTGMKWSFGKKK